MTWSGLDHRQFPRINTQCDLWLHKGFGGLIHAQTENLGRGGACVILRHALEKLTSVQIRLALKEETSPIECGGRIVWTVRSKEPASGKVTYDTGIEFLNIKLEDEERITNFIQSRL